MDATELATKMIEWERLTRQADALAKEIEDEVLKIGKTQVVGNVRVTYSKGRGYYNYDPVKQRAAAIPEIIDKYTTTSVTATTDWRAISDELGIEPAYMPGEPSATIKLGKANA